MLQPWAKRWCLSLTLHLKGYWGLLGLCRWLCREISTELVYHPKMPGQSHRIRYPMPQSLPSCSCSPMNNTKLILSYGLKDNGLTAHFLETSACRYWVWNYLMNRCLCWLTVLAVNFVDSERHIIHLSAYLCHPLSALTFLIVVSLIVYVFRSALWWLLGLLAPSAARLYDSTSSSYGD